MTTGRGKHASAPAETSRPMWLEVSAVLLLAVLVAFVVRGFLLGVYFIPSGSMENTLQINDRVLVDKVSYRFGDIERGDVVVFDGKGSFTPEGRSVEQSTNPIGRAWATARGLVGAAPTSEEDFIKRVIGLPGDRVTCCDAQGRLTVNGVPLDEPYLFPGDSPSSVKFDIEVPPGRLWVMGDHRSASADSRAHLGDPGGGTVPEDEVVGRAVAVIWPFSRIGRLSQPSTFGQDGL